MARRVGIGVVGLCMPVKTLPKHAIKRFDRFLSNRRFDDRRAQEELLKTVVADRKRTFRDQKSHRFGLSPGGLKLTGDERLERILLVTAAAHFLVIGWTEPANWG